MNDIQALTEIDYSSVFVAVFTILVGLKAIISLVEFFANRLGLETKGMRKSREDHELLIQTAKNLTELQKKHEHDNGISIKIDNEIEAKIQKLTDMFINKEINDYRWEIINFATRISEDKTCTKESYKHCFKTYHDYEEILKENDMENGEVEISMEIIRESYKKKMSEGF